MELSDPHRQLADGFKRAFDAYLEQPEPNTDSSHGRQARAKKRSLLDAFPELTQEAYLRDLISKEVGDWRGLARLAAHANGDIERFERLDDRRPGGSLPIDAVLSLLRAHSGHIDTSALAQRVAGYMVGPPEQLWQYIAINVVPASRVELLDGWELTPIDPVHDATLPFSYLGMHRYLPASYHFDHGYGALRRPSDDCDAPDEESDSDDRVLVWPLMILNLFEDHPVHVGVSYYVEPGRRMTLPPALNQRFAGSHSQPKELHRWDYTGSGWVEPRRGRTLDTPSTERLSRFAAGLGSRLQRLDTNRRQRLIRAADQCIIVAHRTPTTTKNIPAMPTMHESEATFRWISAIEGLLVGEGEEHSDLSRKTAQRAAVLVGRDDQERLAVRDLLRTAYGVRSAYAHGGRPKSVELASLRSLTRRIIVAWIVLAADYDRKVYPRILDDALLSHARLEENVRQPLLRFRDEAFPGNQE